MAHSRELPAAASSRRLRACGVGAIAALAVACTAAPAMRAAERGDRASLREAIGARERAGTLTNREAASIAEEVASRELLAAPPGDAAARVGDALACARELDHALAVRMREHDAAGADAALARIAGGGLDLGSASAFLNDADPHWRAVGARALVTAEDSATRRAAMLDANPLVRREAVRAARGAVQRDPGDLRALVDAARLDPEPIVRTEAVRAIAGVPPPVGGQAAEALRDLWTSADDGLREDIALAWASPAIWDAGGREALGALVASGHGPGVIEGAAAILRRGGRGGDAAVGAIAQLIRSIEGGSRVTRLQALAQAPMDRDDLVHAIQRASIDDDPQIRVAALGRLAQDAAHRGSALEPLEALAQPGSPVGERARFALAGAGDRRIQAWIEQDLDAAAPEDRLSAATALATLGVAARAAPLLADSDAAVRVRAACTIVMAARVNR